LNLHRRGSLKAHIKVSVCRDTLRMNVDIEVSG